MYSGRRRGLRYDLRRLMRYLIRGLAYTAGLYGFMPPAGLYHPGKQAADEVWLPDVPWQPAIADEFDGGARPPSGDGPWLDAEAGPWLR